MKKLFLLTLVGIFFSVSQASAQWHNKYKSDNFHGNGVTEYLIQSSKKAAKGIEYFYYTSSKAKRIKLTVLSTASRTSGMEGVTIVKVKFPGDKTVYTLEFIPGGCTCIFPNGKKQNYDYISD